MKAGATGEAPRIFAREYYERMRDLEERHWWAIGMRQIAGRLLDPTLRNGRPVRVLDAGCGTGGMLAWLQDRVDARRLVGIDVSEHALRLSRERGLRRLTQASITRLPFPSGSFDVVVCLDVIQHLPRDGSDEAALRECHRVLSPGGLVYLRTNVAPAKEAPRQDDPTQATSSASDFHQYTRQELTAVVLAAGFAIEKMTYANMLPSLATTWMRRLDPRHRPDPSDRLGQYRGLTMRVPPPWLNLPLRIVMYGEASLLAARTNGLPLGHSLICLAQKPEGA
jgi:ubiquinone/menaquinone biosynthesis C-methylase UbiE